MALLPAAAQAAGPTAVLDSRAWELVSPVEKNGGEVAPLGSGLVAAAAQGGALAFASEASFGEAAGAAPLSQYLASRGSEAWSTANLTPPLLSGTYSAETGDADPYLLFSVDLSRAVLSSGWRCRDAGGEECPAENTPLGTGGPPGYRNLYLREGSTFTPLITETNFAALPPEAKEFHLGLQGGSPDLRHVVFSSAGLLYEWNEGTIAQIGSTGATLAASGDSRGAVSENGSRVYFSEGGALKLREGGTTKTLAAAAQFGAASTDGATAFYTLSEQLFSYDAAAGISSPALASGVKAILGASPDAATLFYTAAGGIFRWHAGTSTQIVSDANPERLPPATGPTAVAAVGNRLFFTSRDSLAPLADSNGQADAYEWEAQGTGSCTASPGCLGLISSGRTGSASFAAASASGEDAYFLTTASLLPADPSALDVYDARSGGGFPEPQPGIECEGDNCQGPPYVPQDPAPATAVVSGPENPPLRFPKPKVCPKGKRLVKRHGKKVCIAKHHKHKRGRR